MNLTLFVFLVTIASALTSLMTEAIKKFYQNKEKDYAPNKIALINAIVIGAVGMVCVYIVMGIPFTIVNIVFIFLMCVIVWIGSMIGYDKILQLITQIKDIQG